MAALINACEGTDEATVTNANSAGPDQFDGVSVGTGCTVVYDSAHAAHGDTSIRFATGATADGAEVNWQTFGNASQLYGRFYFYSTVAPAENHRVVTLVATGFAGLNSAIYWTTDQRMQIVDSNGGALSGAISTQIPINQWVRVEFRVAQSATVGELELRVFLNPESVSPDSSNTALDQNTFGTTIGYAGFGTAWDMKANVAPFWMDEIALSTTEFPGPVTKSTYAIYDIGLQIPDA